MVQSKICCEPSRKYLPVGVDRNECATDNATTTQAETIFEYLDTDQGWFHCLIGFPLATNHWNLDNYHSGYYRWYSGECRLYLAHSRDGQSSRHSYCFHLVACSSCTHHSSLD